MSLTLYDLLGVLSATPFLILYVWLTRPSKIPYEGRISDVHKGRRKG